MLTCSKCGCFCDNADLINGICDDCREAERKEELEENIMITMGEKVKILEDFFNVVRPDDIGFIEWADTLENMEEGYKKKTGEEIIKE